MRVTAARLAKLPRIGPCRDPLHLWYLEFQSGSLVMRSYWADRAEARTALRLYRAQLRSGQAIDWPAIARAIQTGSR